MRFRWTSSWSSGRKPASDPVTWRGVDSTFVDQAAKRGARGRRDRRDWRLFRHPCCARVSSGLLRSFHRGDFRMARSRTSGGWKPLCRFHPFTDPCRAIAPLGLEGDAPWDRRYRRRQPADRRVGFARMPWGSGQVSHVVDRALRRFVERINKRIKGESGEAGYAINKDRACRARCEEDGIGEAKPFARICSRASEERRRNERIATIAAAK